MTKFKWDEPIFIIGNPRSGTSLLRLMLTCHSSIIIPPESHFFLWLEERYCNWDFKNKLDLFLNDLYNSTKFETWKLKREDLKSFLIESKAESYEAIISNIYLFYGIFHNKENITYWGDKNKLWKEKLPKIIKYYPKAKFIHLVRDGRDVACSFKELSKNKSASIYAPKLPNEISEIADRWNLNLDSILRFLNGEEKINFHTLRYEDLIMETEKELINICNYLELPFDHNMINYVELNKREVYEPIEFLDWKAKLKSLPDKSNIGKYKNALSPEELEIFEKIAKTNLKRFNYE